MASWKTMIVKMWSKRLKVAGVVALLASLSLPVGTCGRYVGADGKTIWLLPGESLPEGARLVLEYRYALESFNAQTLDSWETLLAFTWPVMALILSARSWWRLLSIVGRVFELVLIVWSFFLIDFMSTFLVNRAIGGYVALAALSLYAVGAIWEDLGLLHAWLRRGSRTNAVRLGSS